MSNYMLDGYGAQTAAEARVSERVAFIRKTYAHLAGAIGVFVVLEALLLKSGIGAQLFKTLAANPAGWIGVMLLFVAGGFVAQWMAHSANRATQYMGLGLYILLEVIVFLPILSIAEYHPKFAGKGIAAMAGIMTLLVFGGLTAAVFISKKDFSFLGHGLMVAGFLSLGLVICAVIFGLSLGIWFSFLMIALAAGYILYDTSNILHHYPTDQYVGASLALFASVALLFYYIVRLLLQTQSSD